MPAKKHNDNFKHLMLMHTAKNHPDIIEGFVRSLAKKFDEKKCDWDDFVGLNAYKGESFERYLKEEGHWDYTYAASLNTLISPPVEREVRAKHPDIDKVAKQNPTMEMEYRARIAADMMTTPIVKTAFKQKELGRGAVSKSIVSALGASKLSMGAWVQIYKGISKSLSSPKGGSVRNLFKSGGIHEMSIILQAPTVKVAKEKGFVVARHVKDKLKSVAASVVAVAALTLSMADTTPDNYDLLVKQHLRSNGGAEVQKLIDGVRSESPELIASNIGLPSIADLEMQHAEILKVTDLGAGYSEQIDSADFQELTSLEAWAQQASGGEFNHSVKSGDNLWKIAESVSSKVTDKILDGFGYVLNENCSPTEREQVTAKIHQQIIESNNFENPNMIFEGQTVTVPDSVLKTISSDLENRIDFAAECLSPSDEFKPSQKVKF